MRKRWTKKWLKGEEDSSSDSDSSSSVQQAGDSSAESQAGNSLTQQQAGQSTAEQQASQSSPQQHAGPSSAQQPRAHSLPPQQTEHGAPQQRTSHSLPPQQAGPSAPQRADHYYCRYCEMAFDSTIGLQVHLAYHYGVSQPVAHASHHHNHQLRDSSVRNEQYHPPPQPLQTVGPSRNSQLASGNDPKDTEQSSLNLLPLTLPLDSDYYNQNRELFNSEGKSKGKAGAKKTKGRKGPKIDPQYCSVCEKFYSNKSKLRRHYGARMHYMNAIHGVRRRLEKTPPASTVTQATKRPQTPASDSSNDSDKTLPMSPQRFKIEDAKLLDYSGQSAGPSDASLLNDSEPQPSCSYSNRPPPRPSSLDWQEESTVMYDLERSLTRLRPQRISHANRPPSRPSSLDWQEEATVMYDLESSLTRPRPQRISRANRSLSLPSSLHLQEGHTAVDHSERPLTRPRPQPVSISMRRLSLPLSLHLQEPSAAVDDEELPQLFPLSKAGFRESRDL